jgi:hypothetical protein
MSNLWQISTMGGRVQQSLDHEREQLLSHWTRAFARRPCWLTSPPPQVARVLSDAEPDPGMAIRKFHDVLGWCAKGSVQTGGLCCGAIFRTESFMALPQDMRCGSRLGQTVHIEHTVPINVLASKFRTAGQSKAAEAKVAWLLKHSVTTAMKKGQDAAFLKGVTRSTTAFDPTSAGHQLPFRRYQQLFASEERIWDVWNRREVDPNGFTFDEHFATVVSVLRSAGASRLFIERLENPA